MKIKKSALYIPTLVSLVSLLYLLATLCQLPEITNGGRITYIFVSLVVSTLPFFYSDKYTNHLVAITAVIYEVGILWLESFIGRKQCLTSFFVFILIYRILYNGTFYDNFSLCLTYTSDVGSISRQKVFWYFDANLMVWTYFFVVLCLQHVFKRNAERIWQHLRLMILLREKLRHEKECNNKLIDAHFPKDILESVEQLVKKDVSEYTQHSATPPLVPNRLESDDSSSKASGSVKQRNFGTFMGKDQAKLIEEALARDVVEKFDSSDSTMRSPELLSKLDHSDRRNAVIVAIKFFSQSLEPNHSGTPCKSSTSSSESILEHRVRDVLYSLTTHLASFYSITPVRRVGGTWIGCIGFFRSAGNELKNCLATLEFCAHIVRLASQEFHTPVALAFEHGSIVGGFVHSPHFDVYGQEVRHVLQMVDCHYDKKVIIGDNVRFLFSQAMHNDSSLDIKLVRTPLSPPWLARKLAECYTLGNLEHFYGPRDTTSDPTLQALLALLQQYQDVQIMELIDRPTLSKRSVSVQAVFNEHSYQSRGYEFGSDIMQPRPDYEALVQQWNVGQTQQQIATRAALQHVTMFDPSCTSCRIYTAMRCLGRFCSGLFGIDKFSSTAIDNPQDFPQYECPPSNDSAWSFASYFDPDCWKEDIGIEFKTSLRERYNMDHDDIVDFLTEQGKSLTTERLDALHVFIEDALYQIVTKVFVFPGILSMFSFDNPQSEDIESKVQSSLMKKQYGETKRERREGDSLYDTLISVCLNRGLEKNYSEAEGGEEEHLGTFGFQYKWFGSFLGSNKYSKVLVGNSEEERAVKMEVARNLTVSIGSNSHGKHSVPILAASAVTMTQNLFTIEETKQMDDVVANNASIKETTPPADTNYTQYHRSWEKYLADSRAAIHHNLLSFMINFMFVVVSWLFLRDYIFMVQKNTSESMIPFIKVFSLHFLLQLTLERVYGRTGSMLMIVLRFLIIILCPRDILFHRIFHLQHNDETYGDMGGDVPLLIFLTFRLPSHFRQSALLSILDGVFCRLILIIRLKAISKQYPAQFAAALVPLALNFAYLAIHYTCFISYLIEHTLLPYSLEQYKEQVIHTRRLLQLFVPEAACKFSDDIFRPHTYRTMSLAAVHVKPSDKLAGFLSAQDFCNIMYNVGAVIDESIAESGLLKVDNFAGVYVAVVAKDAEWDRITGLRVPSNHNARTIMFLRVLKLKLDKFCKRNNIHITVGIGVDEGSAYMGFIGGKHFHFDVESDMRYKVVCMASYNNDAFYLSSRIEDELEKVFPAEELLHTQKCSEQWGEEYWYAIASTFHGVQLNDFTYTGILGKGGYGAVHLVCEKYTSKQYAIKAINLKENAVLSNMMQRECIILQRMNHPNVINLKYAFMANSRLYLVMSYISCGNLKQVVERDNPSLDVLKLWFAELVQAIQYIHSIGIIHRDIKPANCMIDNKGHLKLGDFGLSKIIRSSTADLTTSSSDDHSVGSNGFKPSALGSIATPLGVRAETYQQLQKYLPLKAYLVTNKSDKDSAVTVPVLHIIFCPTGNDGNQENKDKPATDTGPEHSTKTFDNSRLRLEITTVKNVNYAKSLLKSKNIEAIFLDITAWQADCSSQVDEMLLYLRKSLRGRVPIYLTNLLRGGDRLHFIQNGVKECFDVGINQINLAIYQTMFNIHEDTRPVSTSSGDDLATGSTIDSCSTSEHADNSLQHSEEEHIMSVNRAQGILHETRVSNQEAPSSSALQAATLPANSTAANAFNNVASTFMTTPNQHAQQATVLPEDIEHTIVGTIHYIAPEVINDRKYAEPVDWWALGITIYVCIVKKHVFKGETQAEIRELISKGVADISPLLDIDAQAHDLVKRLLGKIEERVAFVPDIPHHAFFAKVRWQDLQDMDMPLKPVEFKVGKYDLKEKLMFYGEPDAREKFNLSIKQMEERSSMTMSKFNDKRKQIRDSRRKRMSGKLENFKLLSAKRIVANNMDGRRRELVSGESLSGDNRQSSQHILHSSKSGQRDGMFGTETVLEADEEDLDEEDREVIEHSKLARSLGMNETSRLRSFSFQHSMHADSFH